MGSYVFKWTKPANDVHITGIFDDWGKSVQMYKVGDHWEREVDFPSADERVLYKFVVDGEWIVDDTKPQLGDGHYNINNVLEPHEITRKPVVAATTPAVSDVPGAFPETPAGEPQSFSVQPIPASHGAGNPISLPAGASVPNQKDIASNTVESTVTTSKEDYEKAGSAPAFTGQAPPPVGSAPEFSVNPIPASSGIGNPVSIAPGTAIPDHKDITSNTVDSSITTSKEAYDKIGNPSITPEAAAEEPNFSVNPIPASNGVGNPISIPAGAILPDQKDINSNAVDSKVTTSKDDYDKIGNPSTTSEPKTEESGFSVNPIPASGGIGNPISVPAGERLPNQKDITANTIDSTVTTSKEDYDRIGNPSTTSETATGEPSFSVNPIPASTGISNPVSVTPGESLPEQKDITPHTVSSTVTTSKEDYEKAGTSAFPAYATAGAAAGGAAGGAALAGAFSTPEAKENLIPESSLPMGAAATDKLDAGPFISSSGPGTTTAQLASQVPLENAPVPGSGSVDATTSKLASDLEVPLKHSPFITSSGAGTTTAGLAANVPAEGAPTGSATESPNVSKDVPEVVKESIAESHQSPEAIASPEAVKDKTSLEKELLSKTHPTEATGESAAAAVDQSSFYGLATSVPETVEKSMQEAHAPPEAAAETSAVAEKSAVERELLSKISSTDEAGEPAPTIVAATSSTAPTSTLADPATVATSVTDGFTANQPVPDTDTGSAVYGPSAGEIAGGAAVGSAVATTGTTELSEPSKDADVEPPRIPDSQKPDITTEASPATAIKDDVPGQSASSTVPVSGGIEDRALASEPAVKMMQENEGVTSTAEAVTAPASSAAAASTVTPPVDTTIGSTPHGLAAGSENPSTAVAATGVPSFTSAGTTVPKTAAKGIVESSKVTPSSAEVNAPSTPVKKTASSTPASPATSTATSTATDKKKKRRSIIKWVKDHVHHHHDK